jgi:hypothetical protein
MYQRNAVYMAYKFQALLRIIRLLVLWRTSFSSWTKAENVTDHIKGKNSPCPRYKVI